jgi:predicted ATPase
LQIVLDTLRSAEELRHAHSTALALSYVGLIVGLCGAAEALMGAARRLTAISEQHGLRPFLTVGKAFLGWALCQRGDLEQGIAVMEEAIAAAEAAKNYLGLARYLAILADARRRHGQLQAAQAACLRAVQMVSSDSRWVEPEVHRVAALVARDLRLQEPKEAETSLERAVECARKLGLPVFELRCLLDLKSLLGPTRQTSDVDSRIEELAHVRDVDRRAEAAARTQAPSLFLDAS